MTIVTFQSYPGGVDDSNVKSWPIAGHVAAHGSGGPNNRPYGHFTADQTTNDGTNIRVHDWGIASGGSVSAIQLGQVSWSHIAMRVPSANNGGSSLFAGWEVHQSSDYGRTGPAPVNHTHDGVGHPWYYVARGNNNRGLEADSFHQTVWGRGTTGNWYGDDIPFTIGPINAVTDRWTYWLTGTKWDCTGAGWVEIWYADDTNTSWRNVAPRKTGIYTCYNNSNYPMASLYTSISNNSWAIDYANGFYSDDATGAEALTQANSINGFTGSTPSNTSPPSIFGTPQVGQTLTGIPGTWVGSPTLTYQWEWDQRIGTWAAVGGATSLSFSCTATFSGAQVRLRETANGTNIVYSTAVTVLDPPPGPSNRLAIPRSTAGGQRIFAPGNRIPGVGGGGL